MTYNRYNLTFISKIYLELYLNPNLGARLYSIYRIILIVLSIYNFIFNNPTFMLELLDNINNNYLNQLHDDSFINIKDNKFKHSSGSGGQGSSGDNGPPGPNPNPSSGNEPMYEVENSRRRGEKGKRETTEITYHSRSGEPIVLVKSSYVPAIGEFEPKKPYSGQLTGIVHNMQFYYDFKKKCRVTPEMLHFNPGCRLAGKNPIHVYEYSNIRYTHDLSSPDRSKHFCLVEYSDGTTCTIYDIATMAAHIEFYKLNYA